MDNYKSKSLKEIELNKGSIAEDMYFNHINNKREIIPVDLSQFCILDANSDNLTFEQIIERFEKEQLALDIKARGDHRKTFRISQRYPLKITFRNKGSASYNI